MANYSVKVVISAINNVTAPIKKIIGAFNQLQRIQAFKNLQTSLGNVKASMGGVMNEAGMLAARLGGLAAIGGFAFKNLFLDSAMEFERLSTILGTVERNANRVKKSLAWVSDFASRTPFEITEVTEAFVKMRVYGMNPMDGTLAAIGDMSSAMGKSLMQGVEAFADAITGENERLKEFGITAKTVGSKVTFTLGNLHKTVQKGNRLKIVGALRDLVNSRFSGAMIAQSKTLNGLLSNLSDQWTRFSNRVMEGGSFDFIKQELAGFLERLNKMANSGDLDRIAKLVSINLVGALKELKNILVQITPAIQQMSNALKKASEAVGGYGNLLKIVLALMAVPFAGAVAGAVFNLGKMAIAFGKVAASILTANAELRTFSTLAPAATAASATAAGAAAAVPAYVAGAQTKGLIPVAGRMAKMKGWLSKLPGAAKLAGLGAAAAPLAGQASKLLGKAPVLGKTLGMVGKFGKYAGKTLGPLGVALSAAELSGAVMSGDKKQIGGAVGGIGGALAGGAAGAAIGSAVPGIGTVVGGIVGTIVGSIGGDQVGQALAGAIDRKTKEVLKPKKDTLNIAMRIDSEGRPNITNVTKGGSSNINFKADMGLMYTP